MLLGRAGWNRHGQGTPALIDGYRDVLDVDAITTEDGAPWLAFMHSLVARGLSGVQFVISDAHEGLKGAIEAVLAGAWHRCRNDETANPAPGDQQ